MSELSERRWDVYLDHPSRGRVLLAHGLSYNQIGMLGHWANFEGLGDGTVWTQELTQVPANDKATTGAAQPVTMISGQGLRAHAARILLSLNTSDPMAQLEMNRACCLADLANNWAEGMTEL